MTVPELSTAMALLTDLQREYGHSLHDLDLHDIHTDESCFEAQLETPIMDSGDECECCQCDCDGDECDCNEECDGECVTMDALGYALAVSDRTVSVRTDDSNEAEYRLVEYAPNLAGQVAAFLNECQESAYLAKCQDQAGQGAEA